MKIVLLKFYLQLCPNADGFIIELGISKQCVPYKEQNKSLRITVLNCSGYIKAV